MNAIMNKLVYLFCRVESLLLSTKHRIKDMTLLSAYAHFNRKVKVGNSVQELHFCMYVWFGGRFGTLDTLFKALVLSKSLNKRKLDSLANSCRMMVFAAWPGNPG
jgi:hypothetical protein